MRTLSTSVAALAATGLLSTALWADPATPERLVNAGTDAEAANWLTVHRTYDSHRYSPLDEITPENASGLKLAFAVPLGGTEPSAFGAGAMETTPLVKDGKMYVTDPWGTTYKIDVSTGTRGQIEWICDTAIDKDPSLGILLANRGVALSGDVVISNLPDGRVVACDDASGDIVWEQQTADQPGEGFTGAPLAVGDKVIVGQSYGDWATRGWIAALDAATGEEVWRFYTVPEPGQPGSETWLCEETGNPDCWKTGGAAAWVTGSYDPESNTLIYGTGNPVPMFDPEYRPGDNLYSNSAIALDADTGELKWHFQYTPGDYFDYDEVGIHLLIDKEIDGEMRKVVGHFGRNGFFYNLDRTNGSFINAGQYVERLNWTDGVDPKTGKPLNYDPNATLQAYAQDVVLRRDGGPVENCPHLQGGINFWPTAYNPATGMAYGHSIEGCSELSTVPVAPEDVMQGAIFTGGSNADSGEIDGSIVQLDVATGQVVKKEMREYPGYAGVLLSGDLVWVGELDGTFGAYDAETLEQVWSTNLGGSFKAPAMTYAVDGKQYVAIVSGPLGTGSFGHPDIEQTQGANMLYVFSL
ncbi:PQQ-binding-like beta-propeller repeat protein [uncultured Maritimibacter sp.]|jgi:alcohol dehydrogenase (cytochrome c)|uniref:pyrroloquinoline quinone-dependent dehydrogenase n=1 Tax=uncultured Maritimibacter sp. TaxID=991866 RepID=UPI000B0CA7A1|nr:PQQ-binding-like beta-propeller repeat protein [uncultured Maritimibacter sp.]